MVNRREFLQGAMAAAVAAGHTPTLLAARGQSAPAAAAGDRLRVGIIGCGTRGNQVANDWMKHPDSLFVAAADVAKGRLDQTAAKIAQVQGQAPDTYEDYRRILDRKDVDAVLIATPDHWHSPMTVEACAAGKDVYVEKPVSNEIDAALKMIEAARTHKRIVQVGLQQRSWHHFQEAAALFQSGALGTLITHCTMSPPPSGGGAPFQLPPPEEAQAPPADLNWDLFQGPARRKAYLPTRQRNWRSYWDYGGGTVTDWGVHLTDVMLWYLGADSTTPILTSGSAQYIRSRRDPERVPDTFSVTWQFDRFVATLTNAVVPGATNATERYGNYFFTDRAVLQVNRLGYVVSPIPPPLSRGGPPAGGPPSGGVPGGAPGAAPGSAPGQASGVPPAPGASTPVAAAASPQPAPPPPIEAKTVVDPNGMSENASSTFGSATHRHIRNFLDCVKTRQTPVADIAIGFNSSLPCLLARLALRQGQTVRWDGKSAKT